MNWLAKIGSHVVQYMDESTLHGISYIATASKVSISFLNVFFTYWYSKLFVLCKPLQFLIERTFWVSTFILVLVSLSNELANVFHAAQELKLVTSISLKPIDEVPFPTLVLSSGGPIDPLGFVANSQNLVLEDDLPLDSMLCFIFQLDEQR